MYVQDVRTYAAYYKIENRLTQPEIVEFFIPLFYGKWKIYPKYLGEFSTSELKCRLDKNGWPSLSVREIAITDRIFNYFMTFKFS